MNPNVEKSAVETHKQLLAVSLNQVPLDGSDTLVVPDAMGFGTTLDEMIHDLEGYINLIRGRKKKELHLEFNCEIYNEPTYSQ